MEECCKVSCIASRGRGSDNAQHFEARADYCTNTITSVAKDNYIMALKFPCILQKQRSEEGKKIRRQYKKDIGVPYQATKVQLPRTDGVCPTLTTFQTDSEIMEMTKKGTELKYHEHPTKEDLLEYFGQRIRVRKMTPTEALRLMDVDDADIEKMKAAGIAKTNLYKLAGNSIVVSCLYHIFRTLLIPNQPENLNRQPTLFD